MISFSYGLSVNDGVNSWMSLMDILNDNYPDFNFYELNAEINHMRRLGPKFGFRLQDMVSERIICLEFDDLHRELIFKLKYL